MKNTSCSSTNRLIVTFAILILMSILSIILTACSNKTYKEQIDNITYSFQYPKDAYVNPYDINCRCYTGTASLADGGGIPASHIEVSFSPRSTEEVDLDAVINNFISSYENKNRDHFRIIDEGATTVDGIPAKYITYYYEGYTTVVVQYKGKFTTFFYNGHTFKIDVLYVNLRLITEEVSEMVTGTFKIEEK